MRVSSTLNLAEIAEGLIGLARVLSQSALTLQQAAAELGTDWHELGGTGPGAHLVGTAKHPAFTRLELAGRGRSEQLTRVQAQLAQPREVSLDDLIAAFGPATDSPFLDDFDETQLLFALTPAEPSGPCQSTLLLTLPTDLEPTSPVTLSQLTLLREC